MVTNSKLSACQSEILDLISSIPDPEIPCITISDLGIIRGVKSTNTGIVVQLTPTYSGCPAVSAIEIAVSKKLQENGINAKIERVLSPLGQQTGYQKMERISSKHTVLHLRAILTRIKNCFFLRLLNAQNAVPRTHI